MDLKRKHSEILHTSTSRRLSQTTVKEMVKPMTKPSTGTRKPILRFDVHWKHFVKVLGYKPKKSEQGGGVQTLDLPRYATASECLAEMKKLFFPNSQSLLAAMEDIELRMVDLKLDVMTFT